MKLRQSEKGMALVITLMMLAIVTFMAVVFLSLSRRERGNVIVSQDQMNSRMMADAALERAKADMVARINATAENFLSASTPFYGDTNDQKHIALANRAVQRALLSYDLRVSHNFFNPAGFRRGDRNSPWNVGWYDIFGNAYDNKGNRLEPGSDDYYQHIANLQYDPRPPVIVSEGKTNDNRFYIDLNRNGMFDPSATLEVTGTRNEHYASNFRETTKPPYLTSWFSGDPEWIGVLERPDLPHSETNRFIGRYAYIMLPTGKSLDINFIHNIATFPAGDTSLAYVDGRGRRFSRNQGIGSWELNMAGFLVDLHTNVWKPNTTFYVHSGIESSGQAFRDAVALLRYRLNDSRNNLMTPDQVFRYPNGVGEPKFANDLIDTAGDGPFVPYNLWYNNAKPIAAYLANFPAPYDNDLDTRPWHGAEFPDKTGEFPDVQRYFKLGVPTAPTDQFAFYGRFTNAVSSTRTNAYDRYAYYRLLAQMGTDSKPAVQGKINLNFATEPGLIPTNLVSWITITNNSTLPTLLIRSNYTVAVKHPDGGEELQSFPNRLTNFFLIAADAMLKASLVTNVYLDDFGKWRTNYTIGSSYFHDPSLNAVWRDPSRPRYIVNTPVRPDISITNIQIYHAPIAANLWRPNDVTYTNAEYSSALHRILQVAANIYDNMTNNAGRTGRPATDPFFPTVWRPLYEITSTNITITGWEPQENANFALSHTNFVSAAWYFTNTTAVLPNITNVNLYGQPWVIGAKKGWPNFNEFSIQTKGNVTRKLEVVKRTAGEKINFTNATELASRVQQIYMIGFSNVFGLEAWNSYASNLQRNIKIEAQVEVTCGIDRVTQRDSNGVVIASHPAFASPNVQRIARGFTVPNWPGRQPDMDVTNAVETAAGVANGPSDFRVPIREVVAIFPGADGMAPHEYTDLPPPYGGFFKNPATWQSLTNTPDLRLNITNRVRYIAVDTQENRIIDYVTFDNLVSSVDLDQVLKGDQNAANDAFGTGVNPAIFWNSNPELKSDPRLGVTRGIMRQLEMSLGIIQPPPEQGSIWRNYTLFAPRQSEIDDFIQFMNGVNTNQAIATNIVRQAPYAPTRSFVLPTLYQANDPFVHYMISDLKDPARTTRADPLFGLQDPPNKELGHRNKTRQGIRSDGKHGIEFQDPRMNESDDWQFPIAKLDGPGRYGITNFHYRFPNIGALGQIHRGTPWQTIYLKGSTAFNGVDLALNTNVPTWYKWSGSYGTHPTNDWKLVGLFTTAMSDNAARGLLGINQSQTAAWSAVLSGVPVITNSLTDYKARANARNVQFGVPQGNNPDKFQDLFIEPGSVQLSNIVRSINEYRAKQPMGLFYNLGDVLGTPKLSVAWNPNLRPQPGYEGSPFLNLSDAQIKNANGTYDWHAVTDEALECIPARILSLLKEDEPRVTIYCFGQTLKPAPRSFITSSDFYNLCVNYQVTGEYVTKAVVRVEGELPRTDPTLNGDQQRAVDLQRPALKTVVESFEVLAPFE